MNLITMAYIGEAQDLIEKFQMKKESNTLFTSDAFDLLLTGEGPFEALSLTAYVLGKKSYEQVINIGIAGSLNSLPLHSVHEIRSITLTQDGKPFFKTFEASKSGIDLVTSFERILKLEQALPLKGLGKMIDREAWGVAHAAKVAQVPFKCFKVISDEAGNSSNCEVRNKTDEFSVIIANEVIKLLNLKKEQQQNEKITLEGFWLTHQSEIQLRQGLKTLSRRENKSTQEILSTLPVEELRAMELLPKERTKRLLTSLEEKLDPMKVRVDKAIKEWKRPLLANGIQVHPDPQLESTLLKIHFEVNSIEELNHKKEALKEIDFNRLEEIRSGDFHVE